MRAVVFDLDDTLVASGHIWDRIWRDYHARHHGRGADIGALLGGSDWPVRLADACGTDPGQVHAECTEAALAALHDGRIALLDGAFPLLAAAALWVPVAVASAAPHRYVHAAVTALGLTGHVTAVIADEDVVAGKPEPDAYVLAAELLGHDPADCLAVEDSAPGILAARAAGMTVLAIPNQNRRPGDDVLALAAHRAATAADALPILTGIIAHGEVSV
ncbi:haloacid dehalogenase [Acrocarpospora phusangensis]|uniref:Haloacid dehalogenase n=1 Tax=Acrocarpospora phusangensis TaxID=1070424 RepID=A0A919QBR2_9ACTN|nr:HAD family phosphatase [Acrocarpospora phusangensis]GIH26264.1 haloacid dehalogenase [Acrocarpospora phusangensis]